MINGMHAIIYSRDAAADRVFIRDVLGFASVDAGGGWLIFALPPAEIAVHPAESNGNMNSISCAATSRPKSHSLPATASGVRRSVTKVGAF